jgi:hypothetical protein
LTEIAPPPVATEVDVEEAAADALADDEAVEVAAAADEPGRSMGREDDDDDDDDEEPEEAPEPELELGVDELDEPLAAEITQLLTSWNWPLPMSVRVIVQLSVVPSAL